jgi:hypothetical protein
MIPQETLEILKVLPRKRLSIAALKAPAANKTLLFECEKLHSVETKRWRLVL